VSCRVCQRGLYNGPRPYQIDSLVCRDCQKSPAVQMRILLTHAREEAMGFEQAWAFAFSRIRWPHDTTHRREWKYVLESEKSRRVWRSCFNQEPPPARERTLTHLSLAA
jgi:hypothetical protein